MLRKLLNRAKNLRKRFITSVALGVLAFPVVAVPLAATAQQQVTWEGWTKSLNVTAGETEYKDATSAKVDEVVQVQLWFHNRENPAGPQLENTTAKFAVPTGQGKTHVITGTSSATNAVTITDTTTINTTLDRNTVEYIPTTAKFRYNKGAADGDATCETGMDFAPERCYTTVTISDEVVRGGVNLDTIRGGTLRGCNAHHETVTIQVRIKADVVSVNKEVRHLGETGSASWKTTTNAKPGDTLEYKIKFKNEGNTQLNNVMVGDNLPKYNSYVNGTTVVYNGNHPNGETQTNDNIANGGINVGSYGVASEAFVIIRVKLDPVTAFEKCGQYDVRNVGVVRPEGMNEHYNTAQVLINVECQGNESVYRCDSLTPQTVSGRTFKFTTNTTAKNGPTVLRYIYNFGDGSNELATDRNIVEHPFPSDRNGPFPVTVKVEFNVNGQTQTAVSDACKTSVSFQVQPAVVTKLPNTGPGEVLGLFASVSAGGAIAHRLILSRRKF